MNQVTVCSLCRLTLALSRGAAASGLRRRLQRNVRQPLVKKMLPHRPSVVRGTRPGRLIASPNIEVFSIRTRIGANHGDAPVTKKVLDETQEAGADASLRVRRINVVRDNVTEQAPLP